MMIEARFKSERHNFNLDIDLCVPAQGITAVFGPSGSGKTSLLRAIAGLDFYATGFLKVGDTLWQRDNLFIPPHQRSIAYVFQEASLFAHLTVRGNLEYGLKRVPVVARKVSLEKAIDLLGISQLLERKPDKLSGGECQRVAIARALAVSPSLLLMDEPLAGLDSKLKQEVLPYIETLHQELAIPVLYVSHVTDEVVRLANHLVLLNDGSIQAAGAIADMLTRFDLPLAHDDAAAAMVEAVVADHDDNYHLTRLDFAGGQIFVTQQAMQIGDPVRLRLAARDISLTLTRQSGTSILNIFPAIVDAITAEGQAQMMVRLLVAGIPILSRVTQKSATELNLQPGKVVYVQVKSVALLN